MDQSQARIKPFRPKSEPVIGPCFLLLLLLVTLSRPLSYQTLVKIASIALLIAPM